jgi:hypothetical protein
MIGLKSEWKGFPAFACARAEAAARDCAWLWMGSDPPRAEDTAEARSSATAGTAKSEMIRIALMERIGKRGFTT